MTKVIKRSDVEFPASPALEDPLKSLGRKGVIDKDVYDAKEEAQRILQRARDEAAAIVAQARQEGERLQAQAREEGYAAGKDQAASEVSALLARQTQQFQALLASVEPQVVGLTMSIVKKVFGEAVALDPQLVVKVTQNALRTVRQRREITIRAHPEDVAALRQHRRQLLDVLLRTNDYALEEDPAIMRGGVIIETEAGRIDARLETQIAVFEKIFAAQQPA